MTEGTLPLATRRVRRERRLQQRFGGNPFASDARYRQVASGLAILIAIAIGVTPFFNRLAPQAAEPLDAIDVDEVAYDAEALRPSLGPADASGICATSVTRRRA